MHSRVIIYPLAIMFPRNASPLRGLFRISSIGLVTADLKPVPIEPIDLEWGPGFARAVSKVPKYDCKARLSLSRVIASGTEWIEAFSIFTVCYGIASSLTPRSSQ